MSTWVVVQYRHVLALYVWIITEKEKTPQYYFLNQFSAGDVKDGFFGSEVLVGVLVTFVTFIIVVVVSVVVCVLLRKRRRPSRQLSSHTCSGNPELTRSMEKDGNIFISHNDMVPSYGLMTCGEDTVSNVSLSVDSTCHSVIETISQKEGKFFCSIDESEITTEDTVFKLLQNKSQSGCRKMKTENDHENAELPVWQGTLQIMSCKQVVEGQKSESALAAMNKLCLVGPQNFVVSQSLPKISIALILYSQRICSDLHKIVLELLIKRLSEYNILAVSEDIDHCRNGLASWLEWRVREASAIFCVCDQSFHDEWEKGFGVTRCLVPLFKHLVHGLVSHPHSENRALLDKLAIVLPHERDIEHVPVYLSDRQKFLLDSEELEKMAKFVVGVPHYYVDWSNSNGIRY